MLDEFMRSSAFVMACQQYDRVAEAEVNDKLYRHLENAYQQVLQFAKKQNLYSRDAALALGISKVVQARQLRGLFP